MKQTEDKKTEYRRLADKRCSGASVLVTRVHGAKLGDIVGPATRNFPEPMPCPFCGGRPRVGGDGAVSYVECQNSDCHSNPSVTAGIIPDAIHCWNQRKGGN